MIVGYARKSTKGCKPHSQVHILRKVFGDRLDKVVSESGSASEKVVPKLDALIEELTDQDTLVVTDLDRIGRSVLPTLQRIEKLKEKGVKFLALNEPIDIYNERERPYLYFYLTLAEVEGKKIGPRSRQGLERLKDLGLPYHRPPEIDHARVVKLKKQGLSHRAIAAKMGISPSSVGDHWKKHLKKMKSGCKK